MIIRRIFSLLVILALGFTLYYALKGYEKAPLPTKKPGSGPVVTSSGGKSEVPLVLPPKVSAVDKLISKIVDQAPAEEPIKEAVKEAVKEPVKKAVEEAVKKIAKEAVKETIKEVVTEPVAGPEEPLDKAVKEIAPLPKETELPIPEVHLIPKTPKRPELPKAPEVAVVSKTEIPEAYRKIYLPFEDAPNMEGPLPMSSFSRGWESYMSLEEKK
jgi:hypothetical protein